MPKHNETRDPPTDEADDKTRLIQLRIAPETEQQIADLLPAVAGWARDNDLGCRTGEGDVIAFAVDVMHQQVFAKLADMLGAAKVPPGTKH